MKLLFCRSCYDVRKLGKRETFCDCQQSHGRYLDARCAVVTGRYAEVIGLDNNALVRAVQSVSGATGEYGPPLSAWVFPKDYHRITRQEPESKRRKSVAGARVGDREAGA